MPKIKVRATEVARVADLLREVCDELPAHEACGVDSFSIQQRAMEYLDDEGYDEEYMEDILELEKMSDRTARLIVFHFEFIFSLAKLQVGVRLDDVLDDIKSRFYFEE